MPRPKIHSWQKILISSAVSMTAFSILTLLVIKDYFTAFDFDTTVRLQDHLTRLLDWPFSLFSIIGSAEVALILWLAVVIFLIWHRLYTTVLLFMLFFAESMAEFLGKVFIIHPAPPHLLYRGVIHFDLPSSYVQTGSSYPSGHVFRIAFLATFLFSYLSYRRTTHRVFYQILLVAFLFLTIISRIYLGEHWTSDVLGGLLLGVSLGLLPAAILSIRAKQQAKQRLDKT